MDYAPHRLNSCESSYEFCRRILAVPQTRSCAYRSRSKLCFQADLHWAIRCEDNQNVGLRTKHLVKFVQSHAEQRGSIFFVGVVCLPLATALDSQTGQHAFGLFLWISTLNVS